MNGGPYRESGIVQTSSTIAALVQSWRVAEIARGPAAPGAVSEAEERLRRALPTSLRALYPVSNGCEVDGAGIRFWATHELDLEDDLVVFADRDSSVSLYAVDPQGRVVLLSQRYLPIAKTLDSFLERCIEVESRAEAFVRSTERTRRVLNPLERAAARALAGVREVEDFRTQLTTQLDGARILRREFSRDGFVTELGRVDRFLRLEQRAEKTVSIRVVFPRISASAIVKLWMVNGFIRRLTGTSEGGFWRDDDTCVFSEVAAPTG